MDAINDTIDVRRDAAELLGEFHGHDQAEVERQLDAKRAQLKEQLSETRAHKRALLKEREDNPVTRRRTRRPIPGRR